MRKVKKKRPFPRQSGSRPALTPTSGEEQARESETDLDRGHAHSLHFSANKTAEVSTRLSPTETAVWHPLEIDASSEMAEGGGGALRERAVRLIRSRPDQ